MYGGCAGLSERAVDQSGNDGLPVPHLLPCPPPRLPGHCRQGMGRGSKNPSYFSFFLHSPQSFSWTLASHYGKFNAEILSSWYLGGWDIFFVGSSFLMSRYYSNLRDTFDKQVRYSKLVRNLFFFFVTDALRLWLKEDRLWIFVNRYFYFSVKIYWIFLPAIAKKPLLIYCPVFKVWMKSRCELGEIL